MRVVGYGRVSQTAGREGDSFLSPVQQREKVEAWCATKDDAVLVDWIEDLDVSGGTIDREGFQRALSMIEAGEADTIVTAKLDRFARTLSGAYKAIDRLREAGATFVSVDDAFDLSTPTGRLTFNILASFAEFELDRLTAGWEDVHRRNVEAGIHTRVPWGYERDDDRRLVPTAEGRGWVPRIYSARKAGRSFQSIADELNEANVRTTQGKRWIRESITALVESRTYLGEVRYGDLVNTEAHEALVGVADWNAAQLARAERAPTASGERGLLSGVVRCAGCRYCLIFRPAAGNRRAIYQCKGKQASGECPEPINISAAGLDAYVFERVEQLVIEGKGQDSSLLTSMLRELADAEEARDLFMGDLDLIRVLGRDVYKEQAERHAARIAELGQAVDALTDEEGRIHEALENGEAPHGATASTDDFEPDILEQRQMVADTLDAVFVRGRPGRGHRVPLDNRVLILAKGEGPASDELPSRGPNGYVVTPFDW